ncbi:XRE family transcriptional regulator [Rhodobacterales bacterium HKCCE4037]|nr:XRE family transcriptional regulator [Rhodobacterales bacterium HKCCE4037]
MEQFMNDVREYAQSMGVSPSTVVQNATKLGGGAWSRWEAGTGSPTLKTVDQIRKYITENPKPSRPASGEAA